MSEEILPQLEKRTNGRLQFQLFHSATLGKATQMLDYVNRGMAFASVPCNGYFTKTFPVFEVDTLGCYTNGVQGIDAAYRGGLSQLINEYLQGKGLKNLVYVGASVFCGHNPGSPKKPINTPSDFKGLKFRGIGNERFFIEQGGGAPVFLPASQLYEALQRGMIDGVFAQESNWIDWKFHEQVKHIRFIDLFFSPMAITYNEPAMQELSKEDQKVVKDMFEECLETWRDGYIEWDKGAREWLMNKWSGNAAYISKEEKKEWLKIAKIKQDEFVEKHGELAKRALEIIRKHNPVE